MVRTPARVQRLVRLQRSDAQFLQLAEGAFDGDSSAAPRTLQMVIGRASAEEIERCLLGGREDRPMTHRLFQDALRALGARVIELEIHALKSETYFAELRLDQDGKRIALDCRPSDGIALALRAQAPVFVAEAVWQSAAKDK